MSGYIKVTGARIHNLKNIDIEIPKEKLTVITGVSGSGKSSFAFDTLYEEGKRRYLMFSNTQFMVDSVPTFESITGLSPTVAVEQRITRQSNPRSTVGTRTKIGAMLAMLFATYGKRDSEYDDGLPLDMAMFQKNSAKGMCVKCMGSGKFKFLDEDKIYGDMSISVKDILEGKFQHFSWRKKIEDYYRQCKVNPEQTLESLTEEQFFSLKYGSQKTSFAGVNAFVPVGDHTETMIRPSTHNPNTRWNRWGRYKQVYAYETPCPKCNGTGLGEQASHTVVGGKTITELENMYINDLRDFFRMGNLPGAMLVETITSKLECMADVGLHHLALSRPIPTLSGGEIQRLFLASYIIAEMDSIIFIFDEPTIGLHEIEKAKLIEIIRKLIKRGNTVIAVEHDENFMRAADYIVDLGPHAGDFGGKRIFQGTFDEFLGCKESITAPYLTGKKAFPVKGRFIKINADNILTLKHCKIHNLCDVTVNIPLGLMVGVSGVSGSGKSSLITDTLVPKLKEMLKNKFVLDDADDDSVEINSNAEIIGTELIKKCVVVDQKPIGRSRTSCPATYTGLWDKIRALFAKESGADMGMFSLNSTGGCRVCKGDGEVHHHVGWGNFIDMECESCGGTGFVDEAMGVLLNGKNIRDILEMSVTAAIDFFKEKDKTIMKMLQTLERVGMGYIKLGQKTPTISGGEAQRIKLATELGKSSSIKNNVYILDEPTTGLSFSDSERLLVLMQELVETGATVIVTEHDPVVLSNCDYIIEMGPGGGSDGGYVIAVGTPKELKMNEKSVIGRYLK